MASSFQVCPRKPGFDPPPPPYFLLCSRRNLASCARTFRRRDFLRSGLESIPGFMESPKDLVARCMWGGQGFSREIHIPEL
ncbi:hypothetical protein AAMO2058_000344600 [Amorphochlora amoebiformis]